MISTDPQADAQKCEVKPILPPLVSVLTTVFNREPYLASCIESVLAQTLDDLELIIVDDCSTDGSYAVAERYLSDPRVRLYRNETNLGDYPNRNCAASLARGKYLKYVDGDDLIYPHCLEVMVEGMEAFPTAGYGISREIKGIMAPTLLTPHEAYRGHFYKNGLFAAGPLDAIIRRSAFETLGGFSAARYTSDTDFFLRIGARWSGVILALGLVWWRHHDGQESVGETLSKDRIREVTMRRYRITREALNAKTCPLTAAETRDRKRRLSHKLLRLAIRQIFRTDLNKSICDILAATRPETQRHETNNSSQRLTSVTSGYPGNSPEVPYQKITATIIDNNRAKGIIKRSLHPFFSVLIPVRNQSATIRTTIESIQLQNFTDWELIIVDDASNDDTFLVAKSYIDDPRIQVHRNSSVLGKWENHNQCAEYATGDYLKYCHGDDILFSRCLQLTAELLQLNPDSVQALSVGSISTHPGTPLTTRDLWEHEFLNASICMEGPSAMVYRRSTFHAVSGFNQTLSPPDRELALRLSKLGVSLILPARLYWSPRHLGKRPRMAEAYPMGELEGSDWIQKQLASSDCPITLGYRSAILSYLRAATWRRRLNNCTKLDFWACKSRLISLLWDIPHPLFAARPYLPLPERRKAYSDLKTPAWIKARYESGNRL